METFAKCLEEREHITAEQIKDLIAQLPKEFDVNIPYFLTDGDIISENHEKRANFIKMVEEVLKAQPAQNKSYRNEITNDEKKIKDRLSIIEKATVNNQ